MQRKLSGSLSGDFNITGQQLITYSACQILSKMWNCNEAVHHLFIDFKKAYDSVRTSSHIIFSLSLVSP